MDFPNEQQLPQREQQPDTFIFTESTTITTEIVTESHYVQYPGQPPAFQDQENQPLLTPQTPIFPIGVPQKSPLHDSTSSESSLTLQEEQQSLVDPPIEEVRTPLQDTLSTIGVESDTSSETSSSSSPPRLNDSQQLSDDDVELEPSSSTETPNEEPDTFTSAQSQLRPESPEQQQQQQPHQPQQESPPTILPLPLPVEEASSNSPQQQVPIAQQEETPMTEEEATVGEGMEDEEEDEIQPPTPHPSPTERDTSATQQPQPQPPVQLPPPVTPVVNLSAPPELLPVKSKPRSPPPPLRPAEPEPNEMETDTESEHESEVEEKKKEKEKKEKEKGMTPTAPISTIVETPQKSTELVPAMPQPTISPATQSTSTAPAMHTFGRGKSKSLRKKKQQSSERAGLQFPVGRIRRFMRENHYADRIASGAPVYLAAVMEYLVAEVLELAGNAARDNKKKRIIPRHIQLAVRNDDELNKMLHDVTIAEGGVLPNIQNVLLPKKSPSGHHHGSSTMSSAADTSSRMSDTYSSEYTTPRKSSAGRKKNEGGKKPGSAQASR